MMNKCKNICCKVWEKIKKIWDEIVDKFQRD